MQWYDKEKNMCCNVSEQFNIAEFYDQCNSGNQVDTKKVLAYLKSFQTIILWGASYLGKALGDKLLKEKCNLKKY